MAFLMVSITHEEIIHSSADFLKISAQIIFWGYFLNFK